MNGQRSSKQPYRPDPLKPFGTDNYYELLDVPFSASRQEVTRAFRRAMKEWHPDRADSRDREQAEDVAKRLNLAFSVLSDPDRRADYDRRLRVDAIQAQIMNQYVPGFGGFGGGSSMSAAYAPHRHMSPREVREQRMTSRHAHASVVLFFGMLVVAAVGLLLVLSLIGSTLNWAF